MFLSFCFSSSKHNILLLKQTCVEFISIKIGKTQNSSVQKSYSTSRKGTGGRKKKEKNRNKTTTLEYFDNLKKKQLGGKNWCYRKFYITENLISQNYCVLF